MKKFAVSYDLRSPGRSYEPLYQRLADWKAARVLESVWIINWDTTATALRDDLQKYIDTNDGLLVVALTGEAAWQQLQDKGSSLRNANKAA